MSFTLRMAANVALIILLATSPVYSAFDIHQAIPGFRKQTLEIAQLMELLQKVASAKGDEKTIQFRDYMLDAFLDFDASRVYKSPYLQNLENAYKGATFISYHKRNQYNIELSEKGFKDHNRLLTEFGNTITEIGVRKNTNPIALSRSYLSYLHFKTAAGVISHNTITNIVENLVTLLDPHYISEMEPESFDVFTSMSGDEKKVINQFMMTFPKVIYSLDQLFHLHSFISQEQYNKTPYTRVNIKFSYKTDAQEMSHPGLTRFIKKMARLLKQARFELKTESDNTILTVEQNGRERFIAISFLTKDGKFIPENKNKEPVFDESISLKQTRSKTFYTEMTTTVHMKGLTFKTDNIIFKNTFEKSPAYGHFKMQLVSTPETRISERPFYVVPIWLANILLPSYMDNLVKDFSTVLHKGNQGKGFQISYDFDANDPLNVKASHHISGEIVDNFFIRFGLSTISSRLRPDNQTMSEILKISNDFYTALHADIRRMPVDIR